MYDECEVGDLSGKEGALIVGPDYTAGSTPDYPDPLAAQNTHFVAERTTSPPNKWSSILFHDGSPRALCAKIFEGELPTPPPPVEPIIKKGYIEVTNKAPMFGTCQTPVWVGIHDGIFDTYDRDMSIREAFERLVEDGNNGPITADFAAAPGTIWDGSVGSGPICSGETAYIPFEFEMIPGKPLFFSYASMILPSNDAFVANGNPMAFQVYDMDGNFSPVTVESTGDMALDGGTEMNDEIPENTAFFGQTVPNTGVDENGVVLLHPGFLPKGSGGILDDARFANADFTADGYQFMEIKVYEGEKPMEPEPIIQKGYIEVVNKAPMYGTCQTPVWVGIHDGIFDTYDRDMPIREAFERLVEDGNNGPITEDFAMTEGTVWDGSIGSGPICSGESAYIPFEFEMIPGKPLFFSYASMILPSNDAFVANGNPMAFQVFDADGTFMPVIVESTGDMALDGGTEVNDEIPENTAFFGQTVPNTGVVEGEVVVLHPGFLPKGSGGILDDERFSNADFTVDGYQFMEITVYLGEKPTDPPVDECMLEFILWDADADIPLRPLEPIECAMDNEFAIQARPTQACSTTISADMELTGPIETSRLENRGPYMIFGDRPTNYVFGKDYREGDYTISSKIFSERNLQGDLVVERTFDFTIVDCSRRLRGSA